jgi:hypothetical protein
MEKAKAEELDHVFALGAGLAAADFHAWSCWIAAAFNAS